MATSLQIKTVTLKEYRMLQLAVPMDIVGEFLQADLQLCLQLWLSPPTCVPPTS